MEMKQTIVSEPEKEEMRARVTIGGHPVHAMLTDFPIAFFALSFVWNLIAIFVNDQPWYAMTFWTMLAGLIMVVPTAFIGLMDYLKMLRRQHPGLQTATVHWIVNVAAILCFFLSLVFRGGPGPLSLAVRALTFLFAMFGFTNLALGAFLGGRLVYHHGVGVDPDGNRPVPGH